MVDPVSLLVEDSFAVRTPALARSLVPGLASELPPLVDRGDGRRIIPAAGAAPLLRALAEAWSEEGIAELPAEDAARDPLVRAVALQVAQADRGPLRSRLTPVLVVLWGASRALAGQQEVLRWVEADAASRLVRAANAIVRSEAAERDRRLGALARALDERLAAALELARRAGAERVGGPLAGQLVRNRLLPTLLRPGPRQEPDLARAAAILGLPLAPEVVAAVPRAMAALLRSARGEGPVAVLLGGIEPDPNDPVRSAAALAFHPTLGPAAGAAIPAVASARALERAGVERSVARALVAPETARALSTAWRDLLEALLPWDVLAGAIERVAPVRRVRGRWSTAEGVLGRPARQAVLLPRADAAAGPVAVVAAHLGPLRAAVREATWETDRGWVDATVARAWARAAERADLAFVAGEHGIALLADLAAAVELAHAVQRALSGPSEVEAGARGERIALPATCVVPVGVAWGEVYGGTDGVAADLGGPAAARAVALAGVEPAAPEPHPDDPFRLHRGGVGPHGLQSEGVLLPAEALDALVEALGGRTAHVRGTEDEAAGVWTDFAHLPAEAWWEWGDDVLLALRVPGAPELVEVVRMERLQFAEVHAGDARRGRSGRRGFAAPAAPDDPFGVETGGAGAREEDVVDQATEEEPLAAAAALEEEPPTEVVRAVDGGDPFGFGGADPFAEEPGLAEGLELAGAEAEPEPETEEPGLAEGLELAGAEAEPEPETEEPGLAEGLESGFDAGAGEPAEALAPGESAAAQDDAAAEPGFPPFVVPEDLRPLPGEEAAPPFLEAAADAPEVEIEEDWEDAPGEPAEAASAPELGEAGFEPEEAGPEPDEAAREPGEAAPVADDAAARGDPWADDDAAAGDDDPWGGEEWDGWDEASDTEVISEVPPAPEPSVTPSTEPLPDLDDYELDTSLLGLDAGAGEGGAPAGDAAAGDAGGSADDAIVAAMLEQLARHVVLERGGAFVFAVAEREGLVDVHEYDTGGDADEALLRFVRDKVAEGFVPRAHAPLSLAEGDTPRPVDREALARACREVSR